MLIGYCDECTSYVGLLTVDLKHFTTVFHIKFSLWVWSFCLIGLLTDERDQTGLCTMGPGGL